MKITSGIALPDGDTHFGPLLAASEKIDGKGTYQVRKLRAALKFVPAKERGLAIDVGAHVGLWSLALAKEFETVMAFEPVYEHAVCFAMNLHGVTNVGLATVALDAVDRRTLSMIAGGTNSGGAHVAPGAAGQGAQEGVTLDSWLAGSALADRRVDFLKIDVEGYELAVIQGARETIRRWMPVIVVEQKGQATRYGYGKTDAIELLREWGFGVQWILGDDYCLTP